MEESNRVTRIDVTRDLSMYHDNQHPPRGNAFRNVTRQDIRMKFTMYIDIVLCYIYVKYLSRTSKCPSAIAMTTRYIKRYFTPGGGGLRNVTTQPCNIIAF